MISVLFVDDDRSLLEGLRMRLRGLADRWHMEFVDSGPNAVVELERRHFDAVVSDLRMPGMDGAQLLAAVSTRWPRVVRIVLSGDIDLAQTARLVPAAHHCLAKPSAVARIEEAVDRSLRLQEWLGGPQLRVVTAPLPRLLQPPPLFEKLQTALARRTVIEADLVRVISSDAAVSATLLTMVNGVCLHNSRPMTSIDQVVRTLGFTTTRSFATAAEVLGLFSNATDRRLDVARLGAHVEEVAIAALALAADTPQRDDALLAALLHDVGYWVLRDQYPTRFEQARNVALVERISVCEAETRVFGVSHAQIGAYLLSNWGLPHGVVEAVAHHHAPQEVRQSSFDVLAMLAVAHGLTHSDDAEAFGFGSKAERRLDESYLQGLHAPFGWSEAARRISKSATAPRLSA